MNRFELKWRNPVIRLYVLGMLPFIVLSIILFIILPNQLHLIPNGLLIIGAVIIVFTALKLNKKSNHKRT